MRSAIRCAAVFALCLVASFSLRGQTAGHIRGRVVDDDGKPLAEVHVEAAHESDVRTAKTGKDGRYRFPMVPPGSYKVHFSLPSYSEVEKNATVRLDGTANVDAKLFRLSSQSGQGGDQKRER